MLHLHCQRQGFESSAQHGLCHSLARFSGTPAVHDHANVGVRSHAAATSNQSPSFCKGIRGTPFTSDITAGPLGATRTLSPSAGTFTTPVEQRGGSAQLVYGLTCH